ncbi:leucine-rich repeat and guanylate kinase domain-containing protein-like isoform X1 [Coregonus clupeaformis]|uniref:leucine-rich repeat and guanylate kinase domain-containing protein-like isoform X1 n=1 Tax=Coregonus clupeaformis TaxID=59861 RepID=UPI001BE08D56|nr:leucine-rich repeat and guanylate kinase domain-containing protein-like isoform X1 [Coregonus clupeaformis]
MYHILSIQRGNQIEKIENVETLRTLQVLDLSLNRITSLSGLQNLHLLGSINLERDLISEIKEATHIHDLWLLRELNLQRNPVQEQLDYRLAVIFLLQHLTVLDQEKVTAEEKVSALNKYDPPLEVVAAREHMSHMVYQLMQPQVINDSTLPSLDSPYPMLLLTGPQACGKRESLTTSSPTESAIPPGVPTLGKRTGATIILSRRKTFRT